MARATLRDVARAAGTSISAASAVLNGNGQPTIRVGAVTRQRILDVASTLHYQPNPVARSLVTRKTGVLGLVFPYSSAFTEQNPFFTQVMSGALDAAIEARYNVMLHTDIGESSDLADENTLPDPRVDGLLLVLPGPDSPILPRCRRMHVPLVSLVSHPAGPEEYAVNADELTGGLLATRHLIALGHRRIAHFAGNEDVPTARPRREGYEAALRSAGIPVDPALMITSGFGWRHGYAAMQELLALPEATRPTAIFAVNDLCAEGALRLMNERGLRVPEDFSLVGYDGTWYATLVRPPLTSVYMPIAEMAAQAVRMLIELIEGREVAERQPVLPVHLVVRDSTRALPT